MKSELTIKISCELLSIDFVPIEATGEECNACADKIYMNQFRAIPKIKVTLHFNNGDKDFFMETLKTDYSFCQSCADCLKEEFNHD